MLFFRKDVYTFHDGGFTEAEKQMNRLTDNFNRKINYFRISVTDRCNLRCVYCMPKEGMALIGHDDILRFEEIERVVRITAAKGMSKIRITGGEPLVRRGIVGFIRNLCAIPGIEDVSLTTNGLFLKKLAKPLYEAGMRRINISLDSLIAEKYRDITRGGDIEKVFEGISEARRAGFNPIKVNVVVIKGLNDDEVVSFAKLTLERPVEIRFIEFMPVGNDNGWDMDSFVSNRELRERIADIGELEPLEHRGNDGPASVYRIKGAAGRIGFISPLSSHFCESCNRLRLTADGRLRSCLFSDDETDLKELIRKGCSDSELEEIITRTIVLKPMKHIALEPNFHKCQRGMSAIGG